MRTQVRSLAPLGGLRIRRCRELWCRSQTRLGPAPPPSPPSPPSHHLIITSSHHHHHLHQDHHIISSPSPPSHHLIISSSHHHLHQDHRRLPHHHHVITFTTTTIFRIIYALFCLATKFVGMSYIYGPCDVDLCSRKIPQAAGAHISFSKLD